MIYLFRKRNGSIIANSKQSAHQMFTQQKNFKAFQSEYLGAITDQQLKAVGEQAEKDVPITIEKLVKKDGEDTLITLSTEQINEMIENGDEKMERKVGIRLKQQQVRYNELMDELALTADTSVTPTDYSKILATVEGATGDLSGIRNTYKSI